MEIKNILLTGSDGYIGAVLAQKLLRKKFNVTGLDNFYYRKSAIGSHNLKFHSIKKDIRDIAGKDLEKFDAIIHLAGLSNDPLGEIDPRLTMDINYHATVRLAKLAKKVGVKKFLFSSSCSIYGIVKNAKVSETSKVMPLTAYAKSKILSEKKLLELADLKFSVAILRNPTVYGFSPKFRDDLVVNNLVANAVATGKIKILSDGTPWRPLIDVRDLSDIFIEFIHAKSEKINGEIFNIGFKKNNFQVKDVLKIIHNEMPKCEIIFTGEHGKDTRSYRVNFDKFSKKFPHIRQRWPIKKSIRRLIELLKANNYNEGDLIKGKFTRLSVLKKLLREEKINDSLFWNNSDTVKCRSCGTKIINFFSLGQMPLANSFLKKKQIHKEKKYELTVAFCKKCYLVQLTKTIPPKELFRNYIYFSSTSKTIVEYSKKTAYYLTNRLKLTREKLVVEIGSNDGVFLQFFKESNVNILGIDPARNIAKIANKKGVPTISEFFNYSLAKKLRKEKNICANLIYGANVLAHVPEILDFAKAVKMLLSKKGTAVFEFPYLQGLLENKFDTIYHEHLFYYSLIALQNLFGKAQLEIYDAEFTPMQGGSLRIFVGSHGTYPISSNVTELAKKEREKRFDKIETYQAIGNRIAKLKVKLLNFLQQIMAQHKTIAAYSAPAKGMTLLNYFGIGNNYLKFIADKAKEKQGLYAPGIHMPIFPIEKIIEERPNYLLILCWNIADEVMELLTDYKKKGGKFIIPIPKIKVI